MSEAVQKLLTPKEVEELTKRHQEAVGSLENKLRSLERDHKSLQAAHRQKGDRIVELEAKIVLMASLRTDKQLQQDTEALRKDVSVKDQEIARLLKEALQLQEDRKAAESAKRRAEQLTEAFKATSESMQYARDKAQADRDQAMSRMAAAESKQAESDAAYKTQTTFLTELSKIREQAVKALHVLPPAARKDREVRVLRALLKEPEEPAQA